MKPPQKLGDFIHQSQEVEHRKLFIEGVEVDFRAVKEATRWTPWDDLHMWQFKGQPFAEIFSREGTRGFLYSVDLLQCMALADDDVYVITVTDHGQNPHQVNLTVGRVLSRI